ncbi:XTP/dITP diphosphatase [Palaeococcus ferrophilus]|uniref:XTP/dITP diphosphatase n=1 Tax=Palaeococcus ferrophilus TaxID=83868 RepID=UPI00064EAA2E|nr:XTP/dITP diphosphatase [Palaeococcus ferrophilus]
MRITFITSNPGKLREAMAYLTPLGVEVQGLKFPYPEIQADTLEEVAAYGVEWLSERIDGPFFLDDSGLFIEALQGFPGVYSAYVFKTLGIDGILKLMEGVEDRRAYFKSVVAYWDGEVHIFTGTVHGRIGLERRGSGGFGFDPIFIPEGYGRTFAEMTTEEKNRISHRGRAFEAFSNWLRDKLKIG